MESKEKKRNYLRDGIKIGGSVGLLGVGGGTRPRQRRKENEELRYGV